jgi:hypothetical protein
MIAKITMKDEETKIKVQLLSLSMSAPPKNATGVSRRTKNAFAQP